MTLQHLAGPNGEAHKEIVHAKFVVGSDGLHSQFCDACTGAYEC